MAEDLFRKYGIGRQERQPIKLGDKIDRPRMTRDEISGALSGLRTTSRPPRPTTTGEFASAVEKGLRGLGTYSTVTGQRLGVVGEEAAAEAVTEYQKRAQEPVDPLETLYRQRVGTEFEDIFEAEGVGATTAEIGNFVGYIVSHPKETAKLALESTALSAPALAGAGVGTVAGAKVGALAGPAGAGIGGLIGGALGIMSGGAFVEHGAVVTEELSKRAPNMTREEVLRAIQDPELMAELDKKGLNKAAGVAAVDGALFLLGGSLASIPGRALSNSVIKIAREMGETSTDMRKLLTNPAIRQRASLPIANYNRSLKASRRIPTIATQFTLETLGEGAGEALGQQLAYGEVDLAEVGLEIAGGIGPAAVETAIEFGQMGSGKYANILKDPEIEEQVRTAARKESLKKEGLLNPVTQQEFNSPHVKRAWKSVMDIYTYGTTGERLGREAKGITGPEQMAKTQAQRVTEELITEKYLGQVQPDAVTKNEIEDIVLYLDGVEGVKNLRKSRKKIDDIVAEAEAAEKAQKEEVDTLESTIKDIQSEYITPEVEEIEIEPIPTEVPIGVEEIEEVELEPIATEAEIGVEEVILTKANKPYKSERIASAQLKRKGLSDTHNVVPFQEGFAITPKEVAPEEIAEAPIRGVAARVEEEVVPTAGVEEIVREAPPEIAPEGIEEALPEDSLLYQGTEPFQSESIANAIRNLRGFKETHDLVKYQDGWAIVPKKEAEEVTPEEAILPITEEPTREAPTELEEEAIPEAAPEVDEQYTALKNELETVEDEIAAIEGDPLVDKAAVTELKSQARKLRGQIRDTAVVQEEIDVSDPNIDLSIERDLTLDRKRIEVGKERWRRERWKREAIIERFKSTIRKNAPDMEIHYAEVGDVVPGDPMMSQAVGQFLKVRPRTRGLHITPGSIPNTTDKTQVYIIGRPGYSLADIEEVLFHETVGHYGLNRILKSEMDTFLLKLIQDPKRTSLIASLASRWKNIDLLPKANEDTMIVKGLGRVSKRGALKLAEEFLANEAGKFANPAYRIAHKKEWSFIRRLVSMLRHAFRKMSFGRIADSITDNDIIALIGESYISLTEPGMAVGEPGQYEVKLAEEYVDLSVEERTEAIQEDRGISPIVTKGVSELMTGDYTQVRKSHWQSVVSETIEKLRKSSIGKWWTAYGNLPYSSVYDLIERDTLGGITKATKLSKKFHTLHKNLSAGEKEIVFNFFKTEGADPILLPEKVREVSVEAKETIEKFGDDLYALGKIPEETYKKLKGSYLPTRYYHYMTTYIGTGKKKSFENYLKGREDLDAETKAVLGVIRDPSILVPETLATIGRDIALEKMFRALRQADTDNKYGWFLGQHAATVFNGKRRTLQSLELELKEKQEQLSDGIKGTFHNYSPEEYKAVQERALNLKNAIDEATPQLRQQAAEYLASTGNPVTEENITSFIDGNYRKVPVSTQYGAIRGMWVRKEIYDDIVDTFDTFRSDRNDWLSQLVAPGGKVETAHQFWKFSKVAGNIPSWFRNFVGNAILLDISTNTNTVKLTQMLIEEMRNFDDSRYIKMAIDNGLFGATYSASELYLIFEQNKGRIRREIAKREASAAGRKFKEMGWIANEKLYNVMEIAAGVYGDLEGLFKAVRMRDHIETWEKENGRKLSELSADEQIALEARAAEEANKAIFNYSKVPAWLSVARRFPFAGSPFLTFTYKALGATLEALARRPQKFIKYAMFPFILSHLVMGMNDMDDEDYEEIVKKMPQWMKENSSIYILPWKDGNGKWQAMSFGYYLPWGQYTDALAFGTSALDWNDPIFSTVKMAKHAVTDTFGFLGGPFPDMMTALATGKDTFTGRDIFPKGATSKEKFSNMMEYMHNMWMPSWLGPHGYLGHTLDQMGVGMYGPAQQVTEFGTPKETFLQAQARLAGVNIYGFDPKESHIRNIRGFKYKIGEVKKHRSKIMKDKNRSAEEKTKLLRELNEKIKREVAKMREYNA
jgi:hypothetical protein